MSRQEKKEARIERYQELARKAEQGSQNAYKASTARWSISLCLVGHHSERSHRASLDRSHNAMRRSIELGDKAEYYRRKAEAAQNNDAIYAEDDDAVERLEEKIATLEALQQQMKDANKIFRSKKLTDDEKIGELAKLLTGKTKYARNVIISAKQYTHFFGCKIPKNGGCFQRKTDCFWRFGKTARMTVENAPKSAYID